MLKEAVGLLLYNSVSSADYWKPVCNRLVINDEKM